MNRYRTLFGVALLAAIVGVLAYLWLAPTGLKKAPDVSVTTLEGQRLALSELRGQPVLVTFWATSCPSCLKEMPHLIELYHELAPRGFEIIAIAMPYDRPDHVMEMDRRKDIPYPVALDPKGRLTQAFGDVRLTPTSFLIAPNGRIVHQKVGEMDMAKLRSKLQAMLDKTAQG